MEQREQNHVLHELCRVATEEDESQIKEIKESASGTGCALIMYRSHRNHGNHRKCLRHRLRTESEAKNFFYFLYFCGTTKTLRDNKNSAGHKNL